MHRPRFFGMNYSEESRRCETATDTVKAGACTVLSGFAGTGAGLCLGTSATWLVSWFFPPAAAAMPLATKVGGAVGGLCGTCLGAICSCNEVINKKQERETTAILKNYSEGKYYEEEMGEVKPLLPAPIVSAHNPHKPAFGYDTRVPKPFSP